MVPSFPLPLPLSHSLFGPFPYGYIVLAGDIALFKEECLPISGLINIEMNFD